MSHSHPKEYAHKINAGWNWIVNGGSSLAAATTDRQPNWALGVDPVSSSRSTDRNLFFGTSILFVPVGVHHLTHTNILSYFYFYFCHRNKQRKRNRHWAFPKLTVLRLILKPPDTFPVIRVTFVVQIVFRAFVLG